MSLHPDVLTDLVSLYHAHEASEATRALLEDEATRNPRIAEALALTPRPFHPLAVRTPDVHRRVIHDVRSAFRFRTIFAVWTIALLALALFRPPAGGQAPWFPVVALVLAFGGAFLAIRAHHRIRRHL